MVNSGFKGLMIQSQLSGMKWLFKQYDIQMFGHKYETKFHPIEVSHPLQVGEKLNFLTL